MPVQITIWISNGRNANLGCHCNSSNFHWWNLKSDQRKSVQEKIKKEKEKKKKKKRERINEWFTELGRSLCPCQIGMWRGMVVQGYTIHVHAIRTCYKSPTTHIHLPPPPLSLSPFLFTFPWISAGQIHGFQLIRLSLYIYYRHWHQ